MNEPQYSPQYPSKGFPWHLISSRNKAELIAGLADWFGVEVAVVESWLENGCSEHEAV